MDAGPNDPVSPMTSHCTVAMEAVLQLCGAAIVILDANDNVLISNEPARRFLHIRASKRSRSIHAVSEWTEIGELVAKTRQRKIGQYSEVGPVPGNERILAVEVHPIKNGEGKLLIVANDITTLRFLERVRRDFVANVSHELRTPLASIRAMAETLQSGAMDDPEVADRFVNTIITETDRLARIAEDLLILSDAESRHPEKQPSDVSGLVTEVARRFEQQAVRAGIKLTATIEPNLFAMASADQLQQAVLNLVDNAIKYTPSGGSVHVAARGKPSELSISVHDTGIGIAAEHLPRLFERFYRVDKARSRQSGGTGLGLSIVKNIVEGHGGKVEVASEIGRGSVFTVRLPRKAG